MYCWSIFQAAGAQQPKNRNFNITNKFPKTSHILDSFNANSGLLSGKFAR